MTILELIIFAVISLFLIYISRLSLLKPKSHGFYRFLSWECTVFLLVKNYSYWIHQPLLWNQVISWILLSISLYLVIAGIYEIKTKGKAKTHRADRSLYQFEQTTELVQSGIYKYIRHPMYCSLLFLTWGIFFKNPTLLLTFIAIISSICLIITAKIEEKENITYFGEIYQNYCNNTKMLIPFLF